jgi:single-strand DNA-binding protein
MNDINFLSISGRLVRDNELKSTNNGAYFVRGSIASNHSKKKSDGTWEEVPGFFEFICWKHTAEYLHKYSKRGDTLIIAGPIRWSSWEKDGVKHSKVEIHAEQVIIKPKGEAGQNTPEPQGAAHFDGEDIPF